MNSWMVVLIGATALTPIFSALVTLAGALLFLTWLATSRSFSLRDYSAYTKDNRQYSAVGLLSLTLLIYFATLCILVLIQGTSNNDIAAIFAFSQFFYLALMLPFLAKKMPALSLTLIGKIATLATLLTFALASIDYFWVNHMRWGFTLNISEYSRPIWVGVRPHSRVSLLSGNPNTLATLLFPLIFLSFLGWGKKSNIGKSLALLAIVTGLVTTAIYAGNRISLVASPILLFLSWMYLYQQNRDSAIRFLWGLAVLLLTGLAGIWLNWDSASQHALIRRMLGMWYEFTTDTHADLSVAQRVQMLKFSWQAFLDSPWIGHGPQNKYEAMRSYFDNSILAGTNHRTPHNIIASHAVAGGVFALIALGLFLAYPLFISWTRSAKRHKPDLLFFGAVISSSLITLGMAETMLFNDQKNSFYIFLMFFVAVLIDQQKPGSQSLGQS